MMTVKQIKTSYEEKWVWVSKIQFSVGSISTAPSNWDKGTG